MKRFYLLFCFSCAVGFAQEKPWWEIMSPAEFEKIAHDPKTAPSLVGNLWWNDYDAKSIVRQNQITVEILAGKWIAYRGVTSDILRDTNRIMSDTPFSDTIFFIKGNYYHSKPYPGTVRMELKDNLITIPLFDYYPNRKAGSRLEDYTQIGLINRITENELVITWWYGKTEQMKIKKLSKYRRFYYRRAAFVPDP
jgi:hypothetical protein